MTEKYTSVSLPRPLVEKIKQRLVGTGFKSVSDYVTFVLREIVIETTKTSKKEDRKTVKEKLKALGYFE